MKTFKSMDYHGKLELWGSGMTVTHITDAGVACKGKIVEVDAAKGLLHIEFTDGEEGWEKPETCFI